MGPGFLPTVATVAGLIALGVSGLLLLASLVQLYNYNSGVNFGNIFPYALIGLPGAASGFCIRWSCTKGRSLLSVIVALALLATHVLLIIPAYLGIGHLYGPPARVLLALCLWNLVRVAVEGLRRR